MVPSRIGSHPAAQRARAGVALVVALAAAGCPTVLLPDDGGALLDAAAPGDGGGGSDAGAPDGGVCDDREVAGLLVSATDQGVNVCAGTATADDGTASETLVFVQASCRWFGAINKGGTWSVTLASPSYAPATRNNIVVELDGCGRAIQTQVVLELSRPDAGTATDGGAAPDGGDAGGL